MPVSEKLVTIQKEILAATLAAGRKVKDVRLVAVSKTHPAEKLLEAFYAGQTIFGENYVQEFAGKASAIKEPFEWHFIGHLQSNKVRQIAGLVSLIHSVDRVSLAQEISRQWEKLGRNCDILVQVNISGESTKSGTSEADAISLVREIAKLPNVSVKGLMTMPPFFDDPDTARPYFKGLRELSEKIAAEHIPNVTMQELSMGMSGDFEVAIQEGATLVRIGTAIFGKR